LRVLVLTCILLLGVGLRLDAAWQGADEQLADSAAYGRIARGLAEQGEFRQSGPGVPAHPQAATNYSPGLPLLVAGWFNLTGSSNLRSARLMLALLSALSIPLAWILAGRLSPASVRTPAEVTAAAAAAFYPTVIADAGMLLTEPLAGTLIAATLVAMLGTRERPDRLRRWVASGALLGLAAMVRPEYLPIGLLAVTALVLARPRPAAGLARGAAVLAAALALVLAPWLAVSGKLAGHPVPISSGGGQTLFTGSVLASGGDPQAVLPELLDEHPGIRADLVRQNRASGEDATTITPERALAILGERRYPGIPTDIALARIGRDNYLEALRTEPLALAGFLGAKSIRVWWRGRRDLTGPIPGRMVHWLIVALAAGGLLSLAVRRRPELWPILVISLGATAVGAVLVASPRRTLVLWPVIAALAGLGTAGLLSLIRIGSRPRDTQPVHVA